MQKEAELGWGGGEGGSQSTAATTINNNNNRRDCRLTFGIWAGISISAAVLGSLTPGFQEQHLVL